MQSIHQHLQFLLCTECFVRVIYGCPDDAISLIRTPLCSSPQLLWCSFLLCACWDNIDMLRPSCQRIHFVGMAHLSLARWLSSTMLLQCSYASSDDARMLVMHPPTEDSPSSTQYASLPEVHPYILSDRHRNASSTTGHDIPRPSLQSHNTSLPHAFCFHQGERGLPQSAKARVLSRLCLMLRAARALPLAEG